MKRFIVGFLAIVGSLAILGAMAVAAIAVLSMIGTVALRGNKPSLHLLKRIEKDNKVVREFKPRFEQIPIDKKNFETVIEGLFRVVNAGGTGWAASIRGLDICGKTGTGRFFRD